MIVFEDLLSLLFAHGWSQYRLVKEKRMGNSTIQRIRFGKPISTETIDVICELCECQPGDLMHWVPNKQGD